MGSGGVAGSGTGGSGAGGTGPDVPEGRRDDPQFAAAGFNGQPPEGGLAEGLISPSMQVGHQINQPTVHQRLPDHRRQRGVLDLRRVEPGRAEAALHLRDAQQTGGEAESHTVSYARYGDTFYMVTIGGRGINIWDVTSATAPKHIKAVAIPGTNYGDYTEAVWGVSWQGQYIYVGATNNGIKVVDAANPASAAVVKEVPTSSYGGVSAGPLDAIGNVLVVMTPKESGGVATLDISDPTQPASGWRRSRPTRRTSGCSTGATCS